MLFKLMWHKRSSRRNTTTIIKKALELVKTRDFMVEASKQVFVEEVVLEIAEAEEDLGNSIDQPVKYVEKLVTLPLIVGTDLIGSTQV